MKQKENEQDFRKFDQRTIDGFWRLIGDRDEAADHKRIFVKNASLGKTGGIRRTSVLSVHYGACEHT